MAYEDEINKLIPKATQLAKARVEVLGRTSESRPGTDIKGDASFYNHCFQSQFFHEEINKLATEAGLRQ